MSENYLSDRNPSVRLKKRPPKLKTRPKTSGSENIRQYLINSTLHGLKYVGERNISYFERTFFGLAFIFVTILSAYFISNIWQKWSATPMIIALNSKSTSIGDIPFPAITICNMNKAKETKVKNVEKNSLNEFLLEGLCNKRDNLSKSDYSANWLQFKQFILNVSQPCKEMLLVCKFASSVRKCMNLFDTALTDEGLCCTFNQVHRKYLIINYDTNDEWDIEVENSNDLDPIDWTPEGGFNSPQNHDKVFPRPAAGSGSHMGLTLVLNANINEYHCSTTNSEGFKVLLHNPTETPQIQNFGFSITPGYESRVVITPRISDASMKETCGCVLYFMPRMGNETPICSRDDYECYQSMIKAIELTQNDTYSCDCMPGCFELSYMGEVSVAKLGTDDFYTKNNLAKRYGATYSKKNIAIMHVYYEQNFFRSNSKEELIGFTDFLSNTGGLLGLFMGFSVVSLIEIIYFLTFRPYCSRVKSRKNKNSLNSRTVRTKHFLERIKHREMALLHHKINESNHRLKHRHQYFN